MKTKKKRERPQGVKKRSPDRKWRSILEGVSPEAPSLSQAYQLTRRASRVGFDWPNLEGVLKKLEEELRELKEALLLQNRKRIREEIGDLLFVLANISRFLHIHPEGALKTTLKKFMARFNYIERTLHQEGKSLQDSDLMEMDWLWEESKKKREDGVGWWNRRAGNSNRRAIKRTRRC
ncbi:MAG: hypothetical protein HXY44_18165 [Syntrophaceae bacterium]|nr:hypothetical protein [Syntrophaceae bacterium]